MDVQESWNIELDDSNADLDNIDLKRLNGTTAIYQLENIMVIGNCHKKSIQIFENQYHQDTISMANGYFQIKSNPGILNISIFGDNLIYDIKKYEVFQWNQLGQTILKSNQLEPFLQIPLLSLDGLYIDLRLKLKQKKENSIMDHIKNYFSKSNDTVHIFSLASGLMYERLLKIMILSVMKHTQSNVKFWFLKNYLSPTFKQFLPKMAKKYNFEFGLIHYQWPSWLQKQTVKI